LSRHFLQSVAPSFCDVAVGQSPLRYVIARRLERAIAFAGVFLICFMKGAFGGGFAIVGIPLLSLVMDPVTAGGLLAPLFVATGLYALRYWKPSTWSKPDLKLLLPGLVAGIGLGYVLFRVLDHRAVAIAMAVVSLIFVALCSSAAPR